MWMTLKQWYRTAIISPYSVLKMSGGIETAKYSTMLSDWGPTERAYGLPGPVVPVWETHSLYMEVLGFISGFGMCCYGLCCYGLCDCAPLPDFIYRTSEQSESASWQTCWSISGPEGKRRQARSATSPSCLCFKSGPCLLAKNTNEIQMGIREGVVVVKAMMRSFRLLHFTETGHNFEDFSF